MTKFRVLFLVSLMTAISGCDYGTYPNNQGVCAQIGCLENIKKSAFPCVNNQDINARLNAIHQEIRGSSDRDCFTCADYQRLYCREMLDGLKK